MSDNLKRGREAYRLRAWREAHRRLSTADQASPLGREDLELAASAAYLAGRELEFHRFLERAHRSHLEANDPERAARSAFWLGLMLLFRGDSAQAGGWLARARRLVEGRNCVENGYLLLPIAERHLAEERGDAAQKTSSSAVEIGERFGDPDLVACARHLLGRALILRGSLRDGLALLDEVMLAVIGNELSPIVTGLIYCSVIDTCRQVFEMSRAWEWTAALTRWCDQQPEMVAFTSICLVHRAEILQFRGAWQDAMTEARRACERGSATGKMVPPAQAVYRQAELHRLRGEFADAENDYRYASQLGLEPQPGLALLRMAQGRTQAAAAAIRRLLLSTIDPLRRARLLLPSLEILLAAGDTEAGWRLCEELEEIAEKFNTEVLQALAAFGRGAVELAEDDARNALKPLRRAFETWRRIDAPYEAARVRVLIGLASRALGDGETADLELAAARAEFEKLGAQPELARLTVLAESGASVHCHPLTPRQLQVLRLIALGKTNKEIAADLYVSERTIDRHVSNILTRLNVPSRAAATAYAYRHELL